MVRTNDLVLAVTRVSVGPVRMSTVTVSVAVVSDVPSDARFRIRNVNAFAMVVNASPALQGFISQMSTAPTDASGEITTVVSEPSDRFATAPVYAAPPARRAFTEMDPSAAATYAVAVTTFESAVPSFALNENV